MEAVQLKAKTENVVPPLQKNRSSIVNTKTKNKQTNISKQKYNTTKA